MRGAFCAGHGDLALGANLPAELLAAVSIGNNFHVLYARWTFIFHCLPAASFPVDKNQTVQPNIVSMVTPMPGGPENCRLGDAALGNGPIDHKIA